MASAEKILKIIFAADAKAVDKAFASIDSHSSSLQQRIAKVGHGFTKAGKSLTTGLTLPLVGFATVALNEFTEFQQVQAQTEAALKSTGGAANVTVGHIDKLASSLGQLSAVDGEVVQGGLNVLLTFTHIRNTRMDATFDRAALAADNLAARMKIGLPQAMKLVGKAVDDPVKGMTALTRVGIRFTDGQKKVIEHLVATGQAQKAQGVILDALNVKFAGSAKAAGKAASPFTKINLAFRDLAQTVGSIIGPYVQRFAAFIQTLAAKFQALSPHVQKIIVIGGVLAAALGPVLMIVGTLAIAIGALTWPILAVIAATALIAVVIYKNWGSITAFIHKHAKAISQVIHVVWAGIKIATKIAWDLIKARVITPVQVMAKVVIGIVKFIAKYWKVTWQTMKDVFSGLWNGLVAIAKPPLNLIIGLLNLVITAIDAVIHGFNMIPGVPDLPSIPHIPQLAAGTASFAGGLALVGERGPELVGLPRGSSVYSNAASRRMGGGDINVVVHVHGSVSAERDLAQSIRRELIRAARNNSGRVGLS
jgi:hypothetical protein